jgi:hypothetical protein
MLGMSGVLYITQSTVDALVVCFDATLWAWQQQQEDR